MTRRPFAPVWSFDRCVAAVRAAFEATGRVPTHEDVARRRVSGLPVMKTFYRHCGGLRCAVVAAGLTPRSVGRPIVHGRRSRMMARRAPGGPPVGDRTAGVAP